MTSKEFKRRCKYYESFAYAKLSFNGAVSPYIYKYTLVKCDGSVIESYFNDIHVFLNTHDIGDFQSFWIDQYSRSQFNIDHGYFLAFYNRCSEYQKKVVRDHYLLQLLIPYDN